MFSSDKFCKSCHYVGGTKRFMPGSILVELVAWCFFFVPGVIYSIWRHSASVQVCKTCGSKEVIPINSPLAQRVLSKK